MKPPKIPAGHQPVMPYFLVDHAEAFITFLKDVFNAVDRELHRDPEGGVIHAELTIGHAVVMLGQSTDQWKAAPSMNYIYVTDTDAVHAKCLAQGCRERYAPRDEAYGVRSSGVRDKWGNTWWLAQPL